jgi:general secretion pathway protein A
LNASASLLSDIAPTYEEFYRFGQPPFTLAPDPRFLYRSDSHEEALTQLLQAIRRREGIIVLSGDIGTGKTTVCRALLQQLDVTTFTSLVLNPFLSVEELLREILFDFGIVSREALRHGRLANASRQELVRTLEEFLVSLRTIRSNGVLIIDEAQHLSPDVIEELRVLSNFEANENKLLQIVLVGQLNLLETLADHGMRQVRQRISLQAVLRPLTRDQVEAYIAHRLWIAKGAVIFGAEAVDRVFEYSGGIPRVINQLCDRALMLGAEASEPDVTVEMIHRAAERLSLPSKRPRRQRALAHAKGWVIAAAAAAILTTAILLYVVLATR